jgi:ribulose-bisphosphate carboxylase large chain
MSNSACELPPGVNQSGPVAAPRSRILRFHPADSATEPHTWEGVTTGEYKPAADHHCGVLRSVLVGQGGERTVFHVRYFEIAPGGHTTLEHHLHEHVVVVLRGRGEVLLGAAVYAVGFGDTIYVAPHEVHQLRNSTTEPFGFLCLVDAVRDRPVPVEIATQGQASPAGDGGRS